MYRFVAVVVCAFMAGTAQAGFEEVKIDPEDPSICNFDPSYRNRNKVAGNYRISPTASVYTSETDRLEAFGITWESLGDVIELGLRANGHPPAKVNSLPGTDLNEVAIVSVELFAIPAENTDFYLYLLKFTVARPLHCRGFGRYGSVAYIEVFDRFAIGYRQLNGMNRSIVDSIRGWVDEFSLKFYRINE